MTETTPWLSEFPGQRCPGERDPLFAGSALRGTSVDPSDEGSALGPAGITVVERRPSTTWGEQLQHYLVTVDRAIARTL